MFLLLQRYICITLHRDNTQRRHSMKCRAYDKSYRLSLGCKFENIRKHIEERIIRIAKSRNCKTFGQRQERTLDNCKHRKPNRRFAKIKCPFGKIKRRFLQINRRFFRKIFVFFWVFQTWLFPKEDLLLSGVLSSAAKVFRPVFFVKAADCNAF